VGSVDGLGLPVGPVDVLLKQSHGENVRDVLGQNCRGTDTTTHSISYSSVWGGVWLGRKSRMVSVEWSRCPRARHLTLTFPDQLAVTACGSTTAVGV
jgi:hypothetical protein